MLLVLYAERNISAPYNECHYAECLYVSIPPYKYCLLNGSYPY
jgi:hypothetical protein